MLESAWRRVRTRGLLSASKEIRAEVVAFDDHPIGRLRSIQDRLKAKTFRFALQKGIAKARPGKSPRPIVIAPIENRIVQRGHSRHTGVEVPRGQGRLGNPHERRRHQGSG